MTNDARITTLLLGARLSMAALIALAPTVKAAGSDDVTLTPTGTRPSR